jgi:DNA-binding transcriptional MocR family regulator
MRLAPPSVSTVIDFRRSLPPAPPDLHRHVHQALDHLAATADLGQLMHQSVPRGSESDRCAGSQLLQPRLRRAIEPARLIVTNGTQSAILLLLRRLVGANGVLVAERLSYGPLRALAEVAGVHVLGLDIDDHGILPSSFEAACRAVKPAALYCNPTVQNPTTATMPIERRIAIAEIARRYGVIVVEDEALGRLHVEAPPPIAMLAPDLTWYVMGTTKCLAHGLRLAYLVAPSADAADEMLAPVEHLSYWHPAPLASAMVAHWVDRGVAQQITQSIARECAAREQIAREVLGGCSLASKPGSMHVWLELPASIAPRDFMAFAEQRNVLLRASDLFAVDDGHAPQGVRLSLSTPNTIAEVRRGLGIIKELFADLA